MPHHIRIGLAAAVLFSSCSMPPPATPPASELNVEDPHSYANISEVNVTHLDLDLNVLFEDQILEGTATLSYQKTAPVDEIVLDTRGLIIDQAEVSADDTTYTPVEFELGPTDPILGAPLTVRTDVSSGMLRVHYRTSPDATALQWLTPAQTAGKEQPFLFTQSEAIHARSWIPLQDSPSAKLTYSALIHTPLALRAVMSAGNTPNDVHDGEFEFHMGEAIPSYLIALAVGDIEFRSIGRRTGVYAEPGVALSAAAEFEDTEQMLIEAETLFGNYLWGRYDILVLPPSFPYGGMENPRLTFATPTVLAGDKSLVSLIAHELAHSWSGNLVTNATWRDFWINEGFTVYLERRIVEAVYGPARAAMEAVLGREELEAEMERLPDADEILHVNLDGRDPDEGFTNIPYEKGALFLKTLESSFGRAALDEYLRGYFSRYAFRSMSTELLEQDLQYYLINRDEARVPVPVHEWLYEPGIPEGAFQPTSELLDRVEEEAEAWLNEGEDAGDLDADDWSTQEWLHFLRALPEDIGSARLAELDGEFQLTETGNSEILSQWLIMGIKNGYQPAYPRVREFLTSMGRRKFLRPIYEALAATPAGRERALSIYREARPGYHPISASTIDDILGYQP